jgi:hypothetical protein
MVKAQGTDVKKIGKILRDTRTGPGLVMVQGQQIPFSLPGAWRSEQPPIPGLSVEVELGAAGEILGIRPTSEISIASAESKRSKIFGKLLARIR